jgi:hypothetical protein
LVPLLILVSMPFIQALAHAQNTCTSLLLLTAVITAWRAGRAITAGLVAGLLFYKPQLAAVLALALVLDLGPRALIGLAASGTTLLLITLITLPRTLTDWLQRLPANLHLMQTASGYSWERQVTLRGFWRLLLQGRDAGEVSTAVTILTLVCATLLGGYLVLAFWRHRRTGSGGAGRDRLIAATIAAMPLLMPYYLDYDLMLLAIPAVLFAADVTTSAPSRRDRWLIGTWVALFLWLLVSPGVARTTHINLTVPLLSLLAIQIIARHASAMSLVASADQEPMPAPQPCPVAA